MPPERRRSDRSTTRRQFLAAGAGLAALGSVPTLSRAVTPEDDEKDETDETDEHQLERDETPTSATLRDLTVTDAGPFAVGDGGTVIRQGEERWHTTAFDLEADLVGASADGAHLWVAGRDGSIRRLDPRNGATTDRSPPSAESTTLTDLAVPGRSAGPTVYATDRSGRLHWSPDGGRSWSRRTPASGASLTAVDHHCPCISHAVDTNGTALQLARHHGDGPLRTTTVGVENADVNYYGTVSHGRVRGMAHGGHAGSGGGHRHGDAKHGGLTIVGGRGTVLFSHAGGWQRLRTGGATLRDAVARQHGDRAAGIAVGDTGTALAFRFPGEESEPQVRTLSTASDADLYAAAPVPDGDELDLVAVGADGVALDS